MSPHLHAMGDIHPFGRGIYEMEVSNFDGQPQQGLLQNLLKHLHSALRAKVLFVQKN